MSIPRQFQGYSTEYFFDEMFSGNGELRARSHYEKIYQRLDRLTETEISERRQQADSSFLEHGITFTVYGDEGGTERIFPFDLIPRVIPESEWNVVENGLRQRIIALNLFLNDIYHDRKIIKDKIIPEEIINSSKNYRPEMVGFDPPQEVYAHICGTDLIRDDQGNYLVLEDNARFMISRFSRR